MRAEGPSREKSAVRSLGSWRSTLTVFGHRAQVFSTQVIFEAS
jgi:hypothetical protein